MTLFKCKKCGAASELEDYFIGRVLHCKKCGIAFRILQIGDKTSIAYLKKSKSNAPLKSSAEKPSVQQAQKKRSEKTGENVGCEEKPQDEPVIKLRPKKEPAQEPPKNKSTIQFEGTSDALQQSNPPNQDENADLKSCLGVLAIVFVLSVVLIFFVQDADENKSPSPRTLTQRPIASYSDSSLSDRSNNSCEENTDTYAYETQLPVIQQPTTQSPVVAQPITSPSRQSVKNKPQPVRTASLAIKPSEYSSNDEEETNAPVKSVVNDDAFTTLKNKDEEVLRFLDELTNGSEKETPKPNVEEQYQLGLSYFNGNGVKKNRAKAFALFEEAANGGHKIAQYKLASCYYNGMGIEKDYALAERWFRQSANRGYPPAQHCLAVCYANGEGVGKSDEKAVEWYEKAAQQGYKWSQYNLGVRYLEGKGVPKNIWWAINWLGAADDQEMEKANAKLNELYSEGYNGRIYTKKGIELLLELANRGDVKAQTSVGRSYYYGSGESKNDAEAYYWLDSASRLGDYVAQITLKEFKSELGKYAKPIIDVLEKGSKLGYYNAKTLLGVYLVKNDKSEETYSRAVYFWKLAVEQKDPKAMYHLGMYYSKGIGFWGRGKNMGKAVKYWTDAYNLGDVQSAICLGDYYEDNDNIGKAKECYSFAANKGNKFAKRKLEKLRRKK